MDYDFSHHPPRRWSETVDGIIWLPRFIDKARAYDLGTLDIYVFGQSPTDASFLEAAGIDYAQMLDCVRSASDDQGVLAAIERAAPGAGDRLRAWSANPSAICKVTFSIVDGDEGYTNGVSRLMRYIPKPVLVAMIAAWRKLVPLRLGNAA